MCRNINRTQFWILVFGCTILYMTLKPSQKQKHQLCLSTQTTCVLDYNLYLSQYTLYTTRNPEKKYVFNYKFVDFFNNTLKLNLYSPRQQCYEYPINNHPYPPHRLC